VGPELAWLRDVGRARYLTATDDEALEAFQRCARLEGIVPALESAHALAKLPQVAAEIGKDGVVVLNLSGRGDKDLATVAERLGRPA
jgi:tryptophan synthase beta chain